MSSQILPNLTSNYVQAYTRDCLSHPPPFHFPYSHLVDRLLPLTGSIIVSLCNNPIRRTYPQLVEVVHYIRMVVFNCYFQGSPLMGKDFCNINKHWELAKVILKKLRQVSPQTNIQLVVSNHWSRLWTGLLHSYHINSNQLHACNIHWVMSNHWTRLCTY